LSQSLGQTLGQTLPDRRLAFETSMAALPVVLILLAWFIWDSTYCPALSQTPGF